MANIARRAANRSTPPRVIAPTRGLSHDMGIGYKLEVIFV